MGKSGSQKEETPQFESWGRYPRMHADVVPLHWASDFPLPQPPATSQLPVGLGRSYGDVCLLENGTLLQTSGMDRLLGFDDATGLLAVKPAFRCSRSSISPCRADIFCPSPRAQNM